jgi:cyclomaltodextrinase / maltogenic alpha-amylase / neopullulanase
VRRYLYGGPDSVVRSWLRDGADGWRLDVAFDIGFRYLAELTRAAHAQKPGSLVVGEIANYPSEWFPSVDAIMHFGLRHILLRTADGRIDAPTASRMIARMVQDAGIEPMLKSWIYLDNHDTPRLATTLPELRQRRLAQVLQFTLPGAPNLYYGSEVDMEGGDDPEMRAPMRWDRVQAAHPALAWTRQLIALRRRHRALRVGDFRLCEATRLLAFERYTDRAADTVVVVANTSALEVRETVMLTNAKIMDGTRMKNLLHPGEAPQRATTGLLHLSLPPHSVLVLAPDTTPVGGYTNYKRVQ